MKLKSDPQVYLTSFFAPPFTIQRNRNDCVSGQDVAVPGLTFASEEIELHPPLGLLEEQASHVDPHRVPVSLHISNLCTKLRTGNSNTAIKKFETP
jgi:hypothetical protein